MVSLGTLSRLVLEGQAVTASRALENLAILENEPLRVMAVIGVLLACPYERFHNACKRGEKFTKRETLALARATHDAGLLDGGDNHGVSLRAERTIILGLERKPAGGLLLLLVLLDASDDVALVGDGYRTKKNENLNPFSK